MKLVATQESQIPENKKNIWKTEQRKPKSQ